MAKPNSEKSVETESTFEEKITEQTASTAFQLVWGIIEKLGKKGWEKMQVELAMRKYAENYQERHGYVKVLGMSQPIPLHQIYTSVRVVRPEYLHAFKSADEMEQAFKKGDRRHSPFHTDGESRNGIDVANEKPFLNILGTQGSGKSIFLRKLGYEALIARSPSEALDGDGRLVSQYMHARLPVLIELREFRHKSIDLVERITEEFTVCGFPESRKFVEGALTAGGLLVLLDGLDEVPDAKLDEVIRHVRDFVHHYAEHRKNNVGDGNRFVTSCRTAHYKNYFTRFTDVELADFSDEQIRQFAKNWFCESQDDKEQAADRFLSILKQPQNAGALELARRPLLLTFLCLTYAHGQELPPTRATLYRRALEILLREWNAQKRVHNEPAYQELNAELELDLLAAMADSLFREERFFFKRQLALDHIRAFMAEELNAPKSLDADQILTAIEIQQGLIVQRAQDTYSFSHLTIQEYLTAKKMWDDGEAVWQREIERHFFEDRWSVVFELMAGMGKADSLLTAMAKCCQQELGRAARDKGVRDLVAWVSANNSGGKEGQAFGTSGIVNAPVFLLFLALSLPRDLGFAYEMGNSRDIAFALAMDCDLARGLNPKTNRNYQIACIAELLAGGMVDADGVNRFEQAKRLLQGAKPEKVREYVELFEQVKRILQLPTSLETMNSESFCRCLNGYRLILRSKRAAYRVSPTAWNRACLTFFQLPK